MVHLESVRYALKLVALLSKQTVLLPHIWMMIP
jgi:hypothetical protein